MSRARRKKQIRNRIIAFVMAVAMVFTVVKVNSGKKVVKADDPESTETDGYKDGSYLSFVDEYDADTNNFKLKIGGNEVADIMGLARSLKEGSSFTPSKYTIHSQSDNVRFEAPLSDYMSRFDNTDAVSITKEMIPELTVDSVSVTVYYGYVFSWEDTTDGNLTAENTIKLKVSSEITYDKSDLSEGDKALIVDYLKSPEGLNKSIIDDQTLLEISYTAESADASDKYSVSIEDKNKIKIEEQEGSWNSKVDSVSDFYYGSDKYAIINSGGIAPASIGDITVGDNDEWVSILSGEGTSSPLEDGYYTVARGYFINSDNYYLLDYKTVEIKNNMVTGVDISYGDTSIYQANGIDGNKIEVSVPNGSSVNIKITTDEEGSVKVGSDDNPLSKEDSDEQYSYTYSIPANEENADKSVDVNLKAENTSASISQDINVTIYFVNTALVLNAIKVNDTDLEGGKVYIAENKATITAELIIGSGVDDSSVSVRFYEEKTTDEEGVVSYSKEISGVSLNEGVVSGSYTIDEDGEYKIYIVATGNDSITNKGVSCDYGPITIVCDTTAPDITDIKPNQGTDATDPSKLTAAKALRIDFKLTDTGVGLDDSNLGTCSVEGIEGTYSIVKNEEEGSGIDDYYVNIPKDDLKNNGFAKGKNIKIVFNPIDKIGNKTESDSAVFEGTFVKDEAEINITKNFSTKVIDEDEYYDNSSGETELQFDVEVKSAFELHSITLDGGVPITSSEFPTAISEGKLTKEYNEETQIYNYRFSSPALPVSSLTESGKHEIKVSVENVNGFTTGEVNSFYFVDINNPEISLVGSTDSTGSSVITDGDSKWYKEIFIVLTVSDADDEYDTGFDFGDDFTGSKEGVLEVKGVEYDKDSSNVSDGTLVYKVKTTKESESGKTVATEVEFTVYDRVGNSNTASATFMVDTDPPTVSLYNGVYTITKNTTNLEVPATVSDDVKVNSVKFVRINDEGDEVGTGTTITEDPNGDSIYWAPLSDILGSSFADGSYRIKVIATDTAGNINDSHVLPVLIDRNDPVVEIDVKNSLENPPKTTGTVIPPVHYEGNTETSSYDYYPITNKAVDITFTATDSNISKITVSHKLDGVDVNDGIEWNTDSEQTKSLKVEAEGKHVFTISVTDKAGYTGEKTVSFTIDKTTPNIDVMLNDAEPLNPPFYNIGVSTGYRYIKADETDEESVEENPDENDVWIKCEYTDINNTTSYLTGNEESDHYAQYSIETTPKAFDGEGTYKVTIKAKDLAGNESSEKEQTFIIDKALPIADIAVKDGSLTEPAGVTDPEKPSYDNERGSEPPNRYDYYKYTNKDVTLVFTVVDNNIITSGDDCGITVKDDETPIEGLTWNLSGGKYTAEKTFTIDNNTVKEFKISIAAKDQAGNSADVKESQTINFVIDKKEPADLAIKLNAKEPATTPYSEDVSVTLSYTEENESVADRVLTYSYTKPGDSSPTETDKPYTDKLTADGTYVVKAKVVDKAGNTVVAKDVKFIIDKADPEVIIDSVTGQNGGKNSKTIIESGTYFGTKTVDYDGFYRGDAGVNVTFKAFDYNMKQTGIKVYDKTGDTVNDITSKSAISASGNEFTIKTSAITGYGSHDVYVMLTDDTNNNAESKHVVFVYDNVDPELTVKYDSEDASAGLRKSGSVNVSYDYKDDYKDDKDVSLTYTFTPFEGEAKSQTIDNFASAGFPRSGESDGRYDISITVKDKAGNTVTEKSWFVIDKEAPQLCISKVEGTTPKIDKFNKIYKENYHGEDRSIKYGQVYGGNGTVKVSIDVFDYDINASDASVFKVYDNGKEIEATFTEKAANEYTATVSISGEGEHHITASATDRIKHTGNTNGISFIIDTTAPVITTSLDEQIYTAMDAFKSKDAVVGIKVDDDNPDKDDIRRVSVTALSDGSDTITSDEYVAEGQETYKRNAYYTVTYTVVDKAGNTSTAKLGFTIDTTKPQSDIRITTKAPAKISKFSNQYSNTNGHFNTTYTYGQYYNESVAMDMAVFDYNTDSIVVTDNDEVIPVTFVKRGDERVASSITVSSEGEHVVKITVTDKSGNEASNTVSFIIDKSAPSLSATLNNMGSITEQYLASDASVYLSVSDTNKDEDDVTRVVKITRPSASTESSTETGALEGSVGYNTEADYEIVYTAIDRAGNESEPITLTFRVDKTAPALSITGITRDATSPENVIITYSMVEDFYWDVESAVVKIYKKVDGMGESSYKTVDFKAGSANSSMSETFEEDGEYRFEFTAKDKTGNEANETFRFILDKNAPIIILSGVDDYLTDKDVTFGVQVDETFYLGNNVKIEGTIKTLENPDGKKLEIDDYTRLTRTSSANFEQIFKEDGIYNIKVTSKDSAGNETVQSVQFTIDKTKPLIKNLEELADEEEYAAYVEATANHEKDAKKLIPIFNEFNFDYDADDIVTDLTTVTYKLYMDGVLYDGLSDVADGFHELRITAEDEVGNTAERTFYFMLDTVKPGIIVTGVEEGDNLMEPTTITVSLQLAEDTLKAVAINGQEVAITNNTATIEVSEKGDYVLVIEAVDDAGNESTMTIKFEYGKTSSWLWLIIAGGAALLIAAAAFFIILGKKRKKNQ